MKTKETYETFGVGWQQGSYISGSSTFAIDKEDNVYLVAEYGEIDHEASDFENSITVYKAFWEELIPIADAHDSGSMYEKSYRFVERNQKEIISIVRDGGEQDWGRYFIKVFSPRQLNIKEWIFIPIFKFF